MFGTQSLDETGCAILGSQNVLSQHRAPTIKPANNKITFFDVGLIVCASPTVFLKLDTTDIEQSSILSRSQQQ